MVRGIRDRGGSPIYQLWRINLDTDSDVWEGALASI